MTPMKRDETRENRIDMEIIVDAYTKEEQALGWYYYLDSHLNFPFPAKWNGESVEVVGMSEEEECEQEVFVEIRYREGEVEDFFSIPLKEIKPIAVDEETEQAIADWHYWLEMGYDFSDD